MQYDILILMLSIYHNNHKTIIFGGNIGLILLLYLEYDLHLPVHGPGNYLQCCHLHRGDLPPAQRLISNIILVCMNNLFIMQYFMYEINSFAII